VKLKIPAGTQSERVFRLRGKGVRPVRGGSPGDVLCRVRVETPINLTGRQRELLEELRTSLGDGSTKHSPRQKSWLDGVRKFFEDMRL
jgi:molecular chaperone DnaJ